jgi:phosphotriesterase-related protein
MPDFGPGFQGLIITTTMTFIRTVLGDVPATELGLTYSHEHIIIDEGYSTLENPDFILNDLDKISAELSDFYARGGRSVIDTMPADCGRNAEKLAEVSRRSQVNIVAPTGIHLEKYYPADHWRYRLSEDQMAQLFVDDIEIGIDRHDYGCPIVERTAHRAGMIKLATGDEPITPHQEKIFGAVVQAHLRTGAPILTHTNFGRHALAQAALFAKLGADLSHVVLSHVDRNKDLAYHHDLMQTGVRVEYDSAFRWKNGEENWTYVLLEKILPAYPCQVTLGMDMARSSYWKHYGGKPGLCFLLETIPGILAQFGLENLWQAIFYDNPAQLYSFKK